MLQSSEPTASIRVQYTNNLKPITIEGDLIPKAIDELPILLCYALKLLVQV